MEAQPRLTSVNMALSNILLTHRSLAMPQIAAFLASGGKGERNKPACWVVWSADDNTTSSMHGRNVRGETS